MKYRYDLHIHSTMSPCADETMTPNNIMNMAYLMNLDFVSVTDHNDIAHQSVFFELSKSYDFVFVPGVEISIEGFDVLCYFRSITEIGDFMKELAKQQTCGNRCTNTLYSRKYNLLDEHLEDIMVSSEEYMITYVELYTIVKRHSGIVIAAHIDRMSKSIVKKYSIDRVSIHGLELSMESKDAEYNYGIKNKSILVNSDSHDLLSIGENNQSLDLKDKTIESLFEAFGDE